MPHNPNEHIINLLGQNPPYIQRMREQLDEQLFAYVRARKAGAQTYQLALEGFYGEDTHDAIRYVAQSLSVTNAGELPDVSIENDSRFGKTLVTLSAQFDAEDLAA